MDKDFVIYVEHKVRELQSACLINSYLQELNLSGDIFPTHYNREINLSRTRPKLVAYPYCYSSKDIRFQEYRDMYGDIIPVNMHHEQITAPDGEEFALPSDDYSKDIIHISWGTRFAKKLIDVGVKPENIYITGSPRNDALFFDNELKSKMELGKSYGLSIEKKWVFCPLNFGYSFMKKDRLYSVKEAGLKINEDDIELVAKTREQFLKTILKFANSNEEMEIILRPHPSVAIETYQTLIKELSSYRVNNVHVMREEPVSTWLKVSDFTVAWTSTAALEGGLLNKNVILFQPNTIPGILDMEWFQHFPIVKSYDELLAAMKNPKKTSDYKKTLKDDFAYSDGLSSLRIALVFKKLISENKLDSKTKMISSIKNKFAILSKDIPKNLLLRTNLLTKINPAYLGLLEDRITSDEISIEMKGIQVYTKQVLENDKYSKINLTLTPLGYTMDLID